METYDDFEYDVTNDDYTTIKIGRTTYYGPAIGPYITEEKKGSVIRLCTLLSESPVHFISINKSAGTLIFHKLSKNKTKDMNDFGEISVLISLNPKEIPRIIRQIEKKEFALYMRYLYKK